MQINAISTLNRNNVFKNNNTDNKYKKYLEKSNYIEKKVELLGGLSTIAFIGALVTGAIGVDLSKKLKTTEKISLGLMISACLLLGAKWIKGYQLSKQYDEDNKNDTKSNAQN